MAKNERLEDQHKLEHVYWDLKREFGSSHLPNSFQPPNYERDLELVDPLQQFAYHSILFDHLGGPPDHYIQALKRKQKKGDTGKTIDEEQWAVVLEQNMHPNRTLVNPNNAWDFSPSVAPLMKRIFQFDNFLHFITVLLHIGLLVPLTTNIVSVSNKYYSQPSTNGGIIKYILQVLLKRWTSK